MNPPRSTLGQGAIIRGYTSLIYSTSYWDILRSTVEVLTTRVSTICAESGRTSDRWRSTIPSVSTRRVCIFGLARIRERQLRTISSRSLGPPELVSILGRSREEIHHRFGIDGVSSGLTEDRLDIYRTSCGIPCIGGERPCEDTHWKNRSYDCETEKESDRLFSIHIKREED